LSILNNFRFKKEFAAKDGEDGKGQFRDGASAEDLVLQVPLGTVIHNLTVGTKQEVIAIAERILIATGGKGGRGNFHFRSSTRTRPRHFEYGKQGEHFDLRLELKLIADVGLVGLPNVGKSSLLNELTNAQSKVANYAFTTLEPNLGVYFELILADIPGLIEGASSGKGLGIKFLRHVERTKVLFHIISAESENPAADYKTIRKELGAYNKALLKKKEYLFLSKSDMVSPAELKKKLIAVKKLNPSAKAFSIHDFDSIERVKKILNVLIKGKYGKNPPARKGK
jgi:GTP-binding protein